MTAIISALIGIGGEVLPPVIAWIQKKLGYNKGTDALKKQAVTDTFLSILSVLSTQPAIQELLNHQTPKAEEVDAAVEALVRALKASGVLPGATSAISGTQLTITGGTLTVEAK